MNAPPAGPLDEGVALAAAEWYFRLHGPAPSPADQAACTAWRAADPRHEQAWQKARHIGATLAGLPPELALPALDRKRGTSRRTAIKTLALLLCAAPAGWLAWRSAPARQWLADHRTATGERRQLTLDDGTRLHLNTATAVDVDYDGERRLLRLRRGEILIDTAPDPQATGRRHRPFLVETAHGSVRALGTRFVVRQEDGGSRVAVYEGAVEIRPAGAPGRALRLAAGEQVTFTAADPGTPASADPHAADWSQGRLFVRDMRLTDFAAELNRYRPGLLRCDPAVAELRISGAFQLQDTDAVLNSLPEALPVRVFYRSPYWVTLTAADAAPAN